MKDINNIAICPCCGNNMQTHCEMVMQVLGAEEIYFSVCWRCQYRTIGTLGDNAYADEQRDACVKNARLHPVFRAEVGDMITCEMEDGMERDLYIHGINLSKHQVFVADVKPGGLFINATYMNKEFPTGAVTDWEK